MLLTLLTTIALAAEPSLLVEHKLDEELLAGGRFANVRPQDWVDFIGSGGL